METDTIHWEEPAGREYLMSLGGSKSGAHAYLNDTQPELRDHLPAGKYLAPGGDVEAFLETLNYNRAKVVRGCHPLDVFGMVDVIPTQIDVRGREDVRRAVYSVLGHARSNEQIRSFVEYESEKPFDGNIGIFVQDFCGRERGSIVEHPHEKGVYRISHVSPRWGSGSEDVIEHIHNGEGHTLPQLVNRARKGEPQPFKVGESRADARTKSIIELYKRVQDSGLMPSSHSFQMEFGKEDGTGGVPGRGNIKFYQARIFRPYQPVADFDVYDFAMSNHFEGSFAITRAYDAFGITAPEGTDVMHRAELTKEFVNKRKSEEHVVYAHNAFEHHQTTPLDVQPRNMAAFLTYQHHILEHGYYRWLQKAPIGFVSAGRHYPGPYKHFEPNERVQQLKETVRVKLFSDGFRGIMQFVD